MWRVSEPSIRQWLSAAWSPNLNWHFTKLSKVLRTSLDTHSWWKNFPVVPLFSAMTTVCADMTFAHLIPPVKKWLLDSIEWAWQMKELRKSYNAERGRKPQMLCNLLLWQIYVLNHNGTRTICNILHVSSYLVRYFSKNSGLQSW